MKKDYVGLALRHRNKGQYTKAIELLKKAAAQQKRSIEPHLSALEVYLWKQDHEKARAQAERIHRMSPDVRTSSAIAQIYRSCRLQEQANFWGRRCVEADPDHHLSQMQQIQILASTGQKARLAEYWLQIDAREGKQHSYFLELVCKSLTEAGLLEEAKPVIREALERFSRPFEVHPFYAHLAQIAYREKDAERAMELMATQKKMVGPFIRPEAVTGASLQLRSLELTLERVKDPRDVLSGKDGAGGHLAYAIGAPRSGTTLLESFLSAHPGIVTLNEPNLTTRVINVHCGNRYNFPKESLFAGTSSMGEAKAARLAAMILHGIPAYGSEDCSGKLVIDKSPLLGGHVYLIHEVFPAAKFIASIRDPRDAAISYYLTHYFRPTQPEASICETLEGTFRLMMNLSLVAWHLHQREPERCHIVSYEELVDRPMDVMASCFRFLGLQEFDVVETALHEKNTRPMNSLRPDFAHGVSRARKGIWTAYERHFGFLTKKDAEALRLMGYG